MPQTVAVCHDAEEAADRDLRRVHPGDGIGGKHLLPGAVHSGRSEASDIRGIREQAARAAARVDIGRDRPTAQIVAQRHRHIRPVVARRTHAERAKHLTFHEGAELLPGAILHHEFKEVVACIRVMEAGARCGDQAEVRNEVIGKRRQRRSGRVAGRVIPKTDPGVM